MNHAAVIRACEHVGSASALARRLSVTPTTVHEWRIGKRRVPIERCIEIRRATNGAVRCEDLRPDVDWAALREPVAPAVPDIYGTATA